MSFQVVAGPVTARRTLSAKAESLRGLLLLPLAMLIGIVAGLWRLVRRARPLGAKARLVMESDGPLLREVDDFAARFENESMFERKGYGTKNFLMV